MGFILLFLFMYTIVLGSYLSLGFRVFFFFKKLSYSLIIKFQVYFC